MTAQSGVFPKIGRSRLFCSVCLFIMVCIFAMYFLQIHCYFFYILASFCIHLHTRACNSLHEGGGGEEEPRFVLYTVRKGEKWPSFKSKTIFFLISSPFHLSPSHYPPHPLPNMLMCSLSSFIFSILSLLFTIVFLFLSPPITLLLPLSSHHFCIHALHSYLMHML